MDLLSWLDVPFWKKLFSITLFAGATFFMLELFKLLKGWNIKLRKTIEIVKQSYHSEIVKQKELLNKWREKHEQT